MVVVGDVADDVGGVRGGGEAREVCDAVSFVRFGEILRGVGRGGGGLGCSVVVLPVIAAAAGAGSAVTFVFEFAWFR